MLNVRLLRCFVAVANELSFTAAAARLNMAQPALTRAIKQLEDHLEAHLLYRDTRNVRLTEIGHAFLKEAQAALEQITRAERVGREMARGELGQIRIGYMAFLSQDFLAPLLKRFSLQRPNVRVELFNLGTEQQRAALVDHTIDVGLMLGPFSIAGIASRELREEQLVVVMPQDHPLAALELVTANDLRGEKLVVGSESMWSVYRRAVFSEFDRLGISPQIAQEAPTTSAVLALVAAGLGLTIFPLSPTLHLTSQMTVLRPFAMGQGKMTTICAWNKINPNPSVAALLDCIFCAPAGS